MMNKDSELRSIAYKKIKINEQYRFFNSNYSFDNNTIPFFKHHAIINKIKNRIIFSNGAAFLITGLRGVGKSTLIKRVLNEIDYDNIYCLPVYISISRKLEYKDLLFEIIRRLYESIIDSHLITKLKSSIANDIVISYSRTSMSISKSNIINGEVELSTGNNPLLKNILLKNKLTRQAAEDASFLAYSSNDVEHDLIRIIGLLNSESSLNIKTVIVFDELDKLTTIENGLNYFEDVLSKLKNIICSVDAISIFIGGLNLYQKWNDDIAKINSLYDSIFSWHQYVPCIWDSTESLFNLFSEKEYIYEMVEEDFQFLCEHKFTNIIKPSFKAFLIYINFKSKGIPRKIYSEFNNFISWHNQKPYFQISEIAISEIYSYSEIWRKISPIFEDTLYKTVIEMDLTYHICFNLIEYFFAVSYKPFTLEEIQEILLYDDSTLSPVNINQIILDLLEKFVEHHLIQKNTDNTYTVTDLTILMEDNMIVKDKSLLHESSNDERFIKTNHKNSSDADSSFRRKLSRYGSDIIISFWNCFEAKELILDNSQMSIFYGIKKANSLACNAILYTDKQGKKMQEKNYLYKETSYRVTSKYLLDTTDIIVDSYIKTSLREIYNGYILTHLIESSLKTKYIILIIEQILNFIIELNQMGYFNASIKASNIMINKYLNVKVLDIKNLIKTDSKGIPISALGYAAPEMYTEQFDCRSDIYSIGVLLWEMINHKCLAQISFERNIDFKFLDKPMDCSKKLWKIILKATKFDPNERYQTAEEFLQDIHACKEYKRNRLHVHENISSGTVTNLFTNNDEITTLLNKAAEVDNNIHNSSYQTMLLETSDYETTFLSNDDIKIVKAFLVRVITNEVIPIDKSIFKIGRSKESSDYYISGNNKISRQHASIITREGAYYLLDNQTINSTRLNGIYLNPNEEKLLKNGDIIKLANEDFIFQQQ